MSATGSALADSSGERTIDLLARARRGDQVAIAAVLKRALPPLRRWARGRLPIWARDLADTDDLVQETIISTLRRIEVLQCGSDGALDAYLRQALLNRIRNEIRRAKRHPPADLLDSNVPAADQSPLELLVGKHTVEAYENALAQLDSRDREAIIARVELGMDYAGIAELQARASPDAARMAVARALVKLANLADI